MLNPAVTPAFRRRLFALFSAFCTICTLANAQPTPSIIGVSAVCQGDSYFYTTDFEAGHSWTWSVPTGGTVLQNLGNTIEVLWTGPFNSTHSVSVIETDPGTNTSANDQMVVHIVKSVLTCENSVQASVDQDGVSEIFPDNLLEGSYNTYDAFQVGIFTQMGLPLGNTITCNEIGMTLIGKVTDECSGNSCWSTIHVEDKLPPVISCPIAPKIIPCDSDPLAIIAPTVLDNCDDSVAINMVGYQVNNTNVCNGVWITRNWDAVDNYGNHAYCTEILRIEPNGPVDFPASINWTCTQYDQHPTITDPTPLTDSLHTTGSGIPYGVGGPYCQYNYLHHDDTLFVCGNSFKIIRTWTVVDWCTGNVILTDFEGDSNEQLIKVMDYNAPSITVPPIVLNANVPGVHPQPCASTWLLPAPMVFDSCNEVTVKIYTSVGEAIYVNGVDGKEGGNVPFPGLKIGNHIITYEVTDACGNSTEVNVVATVTDLIAPTPICIEVTDVNLDANGYITAPADAFDLASHDNCCIDYFMVKRMGDSDDNFAPSIEFNCQDIPEVMVVLRVFDCFGNFNECMVTVHVNDKVNPICIPPQMKIIPCTDVPPDVTPEWVNGFGTAAFYDNCDATIVELPYQENINACGEGHVIRYWKVTDSSGNVSGTCEQHIYVTPTSDWIIKFPEDFYGSCDDIVDAQEIEIVNFGCDMFAVEYDDQYFALTTGDSACYKIVRTWKVINWCTYDPYLPFKKVSHEPLGIWIDEEDYNNYGSYEYQQIIKIYDDTPPELSYPFANEFCSEDATCTFGDVFLPIQIDGVCSDVFQIVYHLDLDRNLSYDLNGTGIFEGQLPIGKHRMLYIVEDGCQNEAQITVDFEVKDCKKPTAICENGLVVELMLNGMVPVCAEALDYGSYDNCPGELHFSFSSDIGDSCRVFVCDDFGVSPIEIWVTDAAGNQDFCATTIEIQDNMFGCANGAPVSGLIATNDAAPVEGVQVNLNSPSGDMDMTTGADGQYEFTGLGFGQDYTVTPYKNDDPRNGVTTFDLVLMSKHVLGVLPLDSPYKLIAADANKSKTITTFDIVEVRKLILQINDNFSNNTSWRFVEKSYQFPNPANPWLELFPEVSNVNDLPAGISNLDFVAVKIGDVNESATANVNDQAEATDRSSGTLVFEVDDQAFGLNDIVTVNFKAKDFISVYGFQFTLIFNKDLLEFQEIVPTTYVGPGNFGLTFLDQGAITSSWDINPALTLADGSAIFSITFKGKASGQLSEALSLSSIFTAAEAYVGEPVAQVDLSLVFTNASATAEKNMEGYEVYQNIPNPFGKKTVIGFKLPKNDLVVVTVFDGTGKKINETARNFPAGYNEVELVRNDFPSDGLYYYRIESGNFTATRSMSIVK